MKKIIVLLATACLAGCKSFYPETYIVKEKMVASWYMHGTRTASGEKYNPDGLTAAHKTLPFGTRLRLTNGKRTVIVRINDRGPFKKGRQLDLSRGSAFALGCKDVGICLLEVERLKHD